MSLPFGGMFSSRRTESDQADIAREEKHGGRTRAQVGVIGIVVIALVVITAMQMDKLPYLAPISTYSAYFDDAGGLAKGDIVSVSGVQVGTVEGIELAGTDQGTKVKVSFRMDDTIEMGDETQAAIRTETVLGRRNLTVIPHGGERIKPGGSITLGNTIAPYSLQDALEGATDTISGTDTDQLNTALNTLTVTFSETPDQVQGAVDGVARLSKAVADRDDELRALLAKANQVSKIVGDRNDQINRLLIDANALVGEIEMRRYALDQLIKGIGDVTTQLRGFIAENNAQLTPVLEKFDRVANILTDNEKNLKETIDRLGPFANTLGEAVASGPNFDSLVGLNTFGDYTAIFLNALRGRYPQVWQSLMYSAFPLIPDNYKLGPPDNTDTPRGPLPSPTYPKPAPTTRGGR
ncbi:MULTISPECIES: MCE family protein [Gordonia]|uniref:Virulence factor Mce n=3 Tax=Gordonia TaxID=2053 RepID=W9DCE2_9ACTN|nr:MULTISPECIES: MCE family protein [Gordonia]ASR04738.1 mce related protein [Gordonia rubripertincta]ETA07103.1 virulence factor Mce [Gordonia alkanivorans CGMCC 6845]MCK8612757.1 MCE family protein [Gordonia sp. C13]MDH3008922.1 MCE family protein [Gordonia alkanivorans]MDH3017883.1 MCE family protein [Gordonia alkanivorans]